MKIGIIDTNKIEKIAQVCDMPKGLVLEWVTSYARHLIGTNTPEDRAFVKQWTQEEFADRCSGRPADRAQAEQDITHMKTWAWHEALRIVPEGMRVNK